MRPSAGLAALLAGATSISLGVIAVKHGYAEGSNPQSLLTARLLIAAPVCALALPFLLRGRGRRLGWRPVAVALAAGTLVWLSTRAELEGLARLPAGMLTVLLATAPMWVAVLGWVDARRLPTLVEGVAMVGIVCGVAVMAAPVGDTVSLLGVLGGLGSAVGFACFLLVIERNHDVAPREAFPLGIIGAAIALVITDPGAAGDLGEGMPLWLTLALGFSIAGWALLVGVGLGATDSITAAIGVGAEPVLVAVLAYVILGEALTARQLAGGVLVVAALAAVALQTARADGPAAQAPT
jgi:drug/metabolite transporter (DMT)-like permease